MTTRNHQRERSTFVVRVEFPRASRARVDQAQRQYFFAWVWQNLQPLGVHEGTVLSADASRWGLLTESWEVDSGKAPASRDWISSIKKSLPIEIYFGTRSEALSGIHVLKKAWAPALKGFWVRAPREQKPKDWNRISKKAFSGVSLPPFWKILPPWKKKPRSNRFRTIVINPGAGFGTGTHETTQLCLTVMGYLSQNWSSNWKELQVLDFGSGSGILSVGAAVLGAKSVDSVEIDPLAIRNARENARLNQVGPSRIHFRQKQRRRKSSVILANILKPVLLAESKNLVRDLEPQNGNWCVILSGLVKADLTSVTREYTRQLEKHFGSRPTHLKLQKKEWFALAFGPRKIISQIQHCL